MGRALIPYPMLRQDLPPMGRGGRSLYYGTSKGRVEAMTLNWSSNDDP